MCVPEDGWGLLRASAQTCQGKSSPQLHLLGLHPSKHHLSGTWTSRPDIVLVFFFFKKLTFSI